MDYRIIPREPGVKIPTFIARGYFHDYETLLTSTLKLAGAALVWIAITYSCVMWNQGRRFQHSVFHKMFRYCSDETQPYNKDQWSPRGEKSNAKHIQMHSVSSHSSTDRIIIIIITGSQRGKPSLPGECKAIRYQQIHLFHCETIWGRGLRVEDQATLTQGFSVRVWMIRPCYEMED